MITTPQPAPPAISATPSVSLDRVVSGRIISGVTAAQQDEHGPEDVSFRLLEIVGEGGMGLVYRALQQYPERVVALKVIKGSLGDARTAGRFNREITILARLHHRGIAQLYSVGLLAQNAGAPSPFMAMEFVEGVPLTAYVIENTLPVKARVALMAKVCDALAYAHANGVVHRDLKPSNILVDANGDPKVLDFGLAALRDASGLPAISLTIEGELLGTLEYMSPEQAAGRLHEIDHQSDVYSLGVLMYEVLAAKRLIQLSTTDLVEAIRLVQEFDAPPLSHTSHSLRGDLDTIVFKALCKEKRGRYATAAALADDLRRHLADKPILARRPSPLYVSAKFVRRHRPLAATAGVITTSLVVGVVIAARAAVVADAAAHSERAQRRVSEIRLRDAQVAQADGLLLQKHYTEARRLYEEAWTGFELLGASPLPAQLGIWELNCRSAIPIREVLPRGTDVQDFALSPDERWTAIRIGNVVEVRSLFTDKRAFSFQGEVNQFLAFSPDGTKLLAAGVNSIEVFRVPTGDVIKRASVKKNAAPPVQVGNAAYVELHEGQVHIEFLDNSEAGLDLHIPHGESALACALSDTELGCITASGEVDWISLSDGTEQSVGKLPPDRAAGERFSLGGGSIAFRRAGRLTVLDSKDLHERFSVEYAGSQFELTADGGIAVPAPDDSFLEYFSADGKVRQRLPISPNGRMKTTPNVALVRNPLGPMVLWSLTPSEGLRQIVPPGAKPLGVALSSDGHMAAVATHDRVTLFETTSGHEVTSLPVGASAKYLAFDRTARQLALALDNDHFQIWRLPEGTPEVDLPQMHLGAMAFSADGNSAILVSPGGTNLEVFLRDRTKWTSQSVVTSGARAAAISPDSKQFAILYSLRPAEIWSLDAKPHLLHRLQHPSPLTTAVYALDGSTLIGTAAPNELIVSSILDGATQSIMTLSEEGTGVTACAQSLAIVSGPNFLHFVDLQHGDLVRQVPLPLSAPRRVATDISGTTTLVTDRRGGAMVMDFSHPIHLRDRSSTDPLAARSLP